MSYYLSTHMPLVMKHFRQHGLTGYRVMQYDGADAPYTTACTLTFTSKDGPGKAFGSKEAAEVMDDVKNFSNVTPVLMNGEQVGQEEAGSSKI